MTRIALVAVPFIKADLHLRLAAGCLDSARSAHQLDRIAIVNGVRSASDEDSIRGRFDVTERNDVNILARAWNRGIKIALSRGAELVLVSNLDLIFHPWCIDNLLECARETPDALIWSPRPWRDRSTLEQAELQPSHQPGIAWSCFAVNRRLFEIVGEFDEQYVPAYREDSDMTYRMKLRGLGGVTSNAALYCDTERGTIKGLYNCAPAELAESAAMLASLRVSITQNDQRYLLKWGGDSGAERFATPYNEAP
jgi:hypothetical protein